MDAKPKAARTDGQVGEKKLGLDMLEWVEWECDSLPRRVDQHALEAKTMSILQVTVVPYIGFCCFCLVYSSKTHRQGETNDGSKIDVRGKVSKIIASQPRRNTTASQSW